MSVRILRQNDDLEPYDSSFLVVGRTGNGKSSFINSLANLAMGNEPGHFVPIIKSTSYPDVDEQYLDENIERNDRLTGRSQTEHAHFYKMIIKGKTIVLIDTPGFVSTEGIVDDDKNVNIIINAAKRIRYLNGILIVERSSSNKKDYVLEYCLQRISQVVPTAFENGCCFIFTSYPGNLIFQDKWFDGKIKYKLKINNLAFAISRQQYYDQPNKKTLVDNAWIQFKNKCLKFLDNITELNKIQTVEYTSLFVAYNCLLQKISKCKILLQNINKCRAYINNNHNQIVAIENYERTPYHNTICIEHRSVCHRNCGLSLNEKYGTDFFRDCACMDRNYRCKECRCTSENHCHMKKIPQQVMLPVNSFFSSLSIEIVGRTNAQIERDIETKENELILKLVESEAEITKICPLFKISDYIVSAISLLKKFLDPNIETSESKKNEISQQLSLYTRLQAGLK